MLFSPTPPPTHGNSKVINWKPLTLEVRFVRQQRTTLKSVIVLGRNSNLKDGKIPLAVIRNVYAS